MRAKNISVLVAHGPALPVIPGSTIHGMIPPGYSAAIVEHIVGTSVVNEKLELNFFGADGEKKLTH